MGIEDFVKTFKGEKEKLLGGTEGGSTAKIDVGVWETGYGATNSTTRIFVPGLFTGVGGITWTKDALESIGWFDATEKAGWSTSEERAAFDAAAAEIANYEQWGKDFLFLIANEESAKEGFVAWAIEANVVTDEAQAIEAFEKSSQSTLNFPDDHIAIVSYYQIGTGMFYSAAAKAWYADGKGDEILREFGAATSGLDEGLESLSASEAAAESAIGAQLIKDRLAAGLNKAPEPEKDKEKEEEASNVFWEKYSEQCAFLANLENFSNYFKNQRKGKPYYWGGRCIPFSMGDSEQEVVNVLRGWHDSDEFVTHAPKDLYSHIGHKLKIYLVRPKFSKNGKLSELQEIPFLLSQAKVKEGKMTVVAGGDKGVQASSARVPATADEVTTVVIEKAITLEEQLIQQNIQAVTAGEGDAKLDNLGGRIVFDSFSYTMDGSNPATARRDVKAKLKFKLASASMLGAQLQVITKEGEVSVAHTYSLKDLIVYPDTIGNSNGLGSTIINQYSPDYNRIRVILNCQIDSENISKDDDEVTGKVEVVNSSLMTSTLVLNLALEDHEISINHKSNLQYELTISYRGYMETALKSPAMDALADKKLIIERKDTEDAQRKVIMEAAGCPIEDLRSIKKDLARQSNSITTESRRRKIIPELYKRKFIKEVSLSEHALMAATKHNFSNKDYNNEIFLDSSLIGAAAVAEAPAAGGEASTTIQPKRKEAIIDPSQPSVHFFSLGDLMDVVSDVLYGEIGEQDKRDSYDELVDNVSHLKLRFGAGSFLWKNPALENAVGISINILDIPVSLQFFKNWYEEVVVKKERKYYPVITFVRDLVERLITNVMNEQCFNYVNEEKITFRVGHFEAVGDPLLDAWVGYNTKWQDEYGWVPITEGMYAGNNRWGTTSVSRHINENAGQVLDLSPSTLDKGEGLPFFKVDDTSPVTNYTNYAIIYTSSHNVYSEKHDGSRKDFEDVGMSFFKINRSIKTGCVKTASFKRTNAPGLRESRYFNGGAGGMSLLSNHYSVSMELEPNTLFKPGMLCFVALEPDDGDNMGWPTDKGSLSNVLGIGGYHLITKVEGSIKSDQSFTSKVDAIWTRTTDISAFRRKGSDPTAEEIAAAATKSANCASLAAETKRVAEAGEVRAALEAQP